MNDHEQTEPAEPSDLQFDQAEFRAPSAATVSCTVCHRAVPEQYYEINGKVICGPCRKGIEERLTGGSGLKRLVRAALFGSVAAAAGCGIYFAVSALTGYKLAIISILVGWMVGTAVRKGAQFRGGWVYQAMAIFLTYTAIVAIDIPQIVVALAGLQKNQAAAAGQPAEAAPKPVAEGAPRPVAEAGPKPAAEAEPTAPAEAGAKPAGEAEPKPVVPAQANEAPAGPQAQAAPKVVNDASPGEKAVALLLFGVVLLGLAYALPFMAGFHNPIGLLIVFFALQQAWRLNRTPRFAITGPYRVGEPDRHADDVGEAPLEGAPADA